MRKPRAVPKVRLNLDMSTDVRDRLDELRDRSNADSRSELLRRALAVYDLLVTNEIEGGVAIVRGSDGKESRLVFAEAVWAK
jgi:metal-responsive CopG/Arc/MetJ family transcriptional regulator